MNTPHNLSEREMFYWIFLGLPALACLFFSLWLAGGGDLSGTVADAETSVQPILVTEPTQAITLTTPLRFTVDETLIVFDEPNGNVIGSFAAGRSYDVVAEKSGWYQIYGDGDTKTVWVPSDRIAFEGTAPISYDPTAAPEQPVVAQPQPTAIPPVPQPVAAPVVREVSVAPVAPPAPAPVEYPNDVDDVPPLTTAEEAVLQQQLMMGALGGAMAQEVQP